MHTSKIWRQMKMGIREGVFRSSLALVTLRNHPPIIYQLFHAQWLWLSAKKKFFVWVRQGPSDVRLDWKNDWKHTYFTWYLPATKTGVSLSVLNAQRRWFTCKSQGCIFSILPPPSGEKGKKRRGKENLRKGRRKKRWRKSEGKREKIWKEPWRKVIWERNNDKYDFMFLKSLWFTAYLLIHIFPII